MGLFSWLCSKTEQSIATPYAGLDPEQSRVVMVTPNNRVIEGSYDGYGCINDYDVFTEIMRDLRPDITDEEALRDAYFTDFYGHNRYIKIVLASAYEGETFEELAAAKDCPHQGYFYEEDDDCDDDDWEEWDDEESDISFSMD